MSAVFNVDMTPEWLSIRHEPDYRWRVWYFGRNTEADAHGHEIRWPPTMSRYSFDDGCVIEFQKWGAVE